MEIPSRNQHEYPSYRLDMQIKKLLADLLRKEESGTSLAEQMFNGTGDGIIIIDSDYRILFENKATKVVLGDNEDKICYEAYQKRSAPCETCPAALSMRDGQPHKAEKTIATPMGLLHIEVMSSPIMDANGKIIAATEVVRNITARKNLEEERERLISELPQALEQVTMLKGLIPICPPAKKYATTRGSGIRSKGISANMPTPSLPTASALTARKKKKQQH